jgi:hypothetical protein
VGELAILVTTHMGAAVKDMTTPVTEGMDRVVVDIGISMDTGCRERVFGSLVLDRHEVQWPVLRGGCLLCSKSQLALTLYG